MNIDEIIKTLKSDVIILSANYQNRWLVNDLQLAAKTIEALKKQLEDNNE